MKFQNKFSFMLEKLPKGLIFIFSFTLLFATKNATAQDEKYYQYQRALRAQEAADRESVRQNAENNRPFDTKSGSASGVFGDISNGRRAKEQEQHRIVMHQIEAQIKLNNKMINDNAKRFAAARVPYVDYFVSSGLFNKEEAEAIAVQTITMDVGKPTIQNTYFTSTAPFNLKAAASYIDFNALAATAPFDELVQFALDFCVAPAKSVSALQSLITRFPDKQQDIDKALILALQGRYGNNKKFYCVVCQEAEGEKLDALFFALAHKYPTEMGAAIDTTYTKDGYTKKILEYTYQGKKGMQNLLKIQEEYLLLPTNKLGTRIYNCSEFLSSKDLAYLTALAAKSNKQPLSPLIGNDFKEYDEAMLWKKEQYFDNYYHASKQDPLSPWSADMLHQLALKGDPDAMNVYGLRTIHGWTKDKEIEGPKWLEKAKAAGSTQAEKNLQDICAQPVKALKTYCTH